MTPPSRSTDAATETTVAAALAASRDAVADAIFAAVRTGPGAVIDASAGTGKTYRLEELVLGLLTETDTPLPEILIVTFTERATAELVTRIRAAIDRGIGAAATPDAARRRLSRARRSFDQANITTIHAFCQRILTEEPLATRRLLGQTQIDTQAAFSAAFRDVLRRTLSTELRYKDTLDAFLDTGRDVGALEAILGKAATARGRWAFPYDEDKLGAVVDDLAALEIEALSASWSAILKNVRSVEALQKRLVPLWSSLRAAAQDRRWGALLGVLDDVNDQTFQSHIQKIGVARTHSTDVARFHRGIVALLVAAPPLEEAIVQRFAPPVLDELRRRKLGLGLYDFDDMITGVSEALDGPAGPDLVDKLRRRFRYALVDEAQDTEQAQWRIFERVFLAPEGGGRPTTDDGARPIVLIGDPKQAIYGFRGADVHTYAAARAQIEARGGKIIPLERNYRSVDQVVDAVNAILEQNAIPAYFTGDVVTYDHPVSSARGGGDPDAGVTLFQLDGAGDAPAASPRIGLIKQALRSAITAEIARLRARPGGPRLAQIFVLSRTNAEAREVGADLRAAGIPHAFYKQEGLWKTPEAAHVRALLGAIDNPSDRVARMHAWLTPFFDVGLHQLWTLREPLEEHADHPLLARLWAWKALADARDYAALWARVLDDSGLGRRLRLLPTGRRRLNNYRQILDQLLADAAARPATIGELAATLGRYAAGQFPPGPAGVGGGDVDIQRAELDVDAVQLITMHKAKGLEAEYVFLYGALTTMRVWRDVHTFHEGADRVFCIGKPRLQRTGEQIDAARREEDQRLLYVGMTRARRRLYLPFFPAVNVGDPEAPGRDNDYELFKKITGPYRHVNQRLQALHRDEPRFRALFQVAPVPYPARAPQDAAKLGRALDGWMPPALDGGDEPDRERIAALRTERRGFVITSYSRMKDAEGGYQAPALDETQPESPGSDDEAAARGATDARRADGAHDPAAGAAAAAGAEETPAGAELPGGAANGLFLHAVLEKAGLGTLPPVAEWERQPAVRRLIDAELRRWDRDPRHAGAAARLVHAGLTTAIPMPDGTILPGIARAARVRREVDFLFPLSGQASPSNADGALIAVPPTTSDGEARLGHEGGFVRGVLDVLFEHADRVCFADWKSDALPRYTPDALDAHIGANYQLQIQIYSVALSRLLRISGEADHERRFGGLVYVFLRGLAAGDATGLHVARPSYADIQSWERALHAAPLGRAPEPA